METQELAELLKAVHGNVSPIIDEIVSEYYPYHTFDIHFEYGERIHIELEIPTKGWKAGTTPRGTLITEDLIRGYFKFSKIVGDYCANLLIPFYGRKLNDSGEEIIFFIQRIRSYYSPLWIVKESKTSTLSFSSILSSKDQVFRTLSETTEIVTGNIRIKIHPGVRIYGSPEFISENIGQTFISKFMTAFRR
jgi:hypothetical protein